MNIDFKSLLLDVYGGSSENPRSSEYVFGAYLRDAAAERISDERFQGDAASMNPFKVLFDDALRKQYHLSVKKSVDFSFDKTKSVEENKAEKAESVDRKARKWAYEAARDRAEFMGRAVDAIFRDEDWSGDSTRLVRDVVSATVGLYDVAYENDAGGNKEEMKNGFAAIVSPLICKIWDNPRSAAEFERLAHDPAQFGVSYSDGELFESIALCAMRSEAKERYEISDWLTRDCDRDATRAISAVLKGTEARAEAGPVNDFVNLIRDVENITTDMCIRGSMRCCYFRDFPKARPESTFSECAGMCETSENWAYLGECYSEMYGEMMLSSVRHDNDASTRALARGAMRSMRDDLFRAFDREKPELQCRSAFLQSLSGPLLCDLQRHKFEDNPGLSADMALEVRNVLNGRTEGCAHYAAGKSSYEAVHDSWGRHVAHLARDMDNPQEAGPEPTYGEDLYDGLRFPSYEIDREYAAQSRLLDTPVREWDMNTAVDLIFCKRIPEAYAFDDVFDFVAERCETADDFRAMGRMYSEAYSATAKDGRGIDGRTGRDAWNRERAAAKRFEKVCRREKLGGGSDEAARAFLDGFSSEALDKLFGPIAGVGGACGFSFEMWSDAMKARKQAEKAAGARASGRTPIPDYVGPQEEGPEGPEAELE